MTIQRFTSGERLVHRSIAILMLTCITTAAILYNGFLAVPVGHRRLVKLVHVYSGYALPVPLIAGLLSTAYRADLRLLNRFRPSDWQWLRSRRRRDGTIEVGKFNAGQKLNAALSAGSIIVMLGTGTLMYFPSLTRLSWRTGASFVHDSVALGLGLLVIGHITYAVRDPNHAAACAPARSRPRGPNSTTPPGQPSSTTNSLSGEPDDGLPGRRDGPGFVRLDVAEPRPDERRAQLVRCAQ